MLTLKRETYLSLGFGIVALLFVVLAIIGGVKAYSPVPYMDMWDGYLGFYEKLAQGDWSAWWAQHNEHRIVLARIFFWLDFKFFHGMGWFLLVVNYVLLGLVCGLFWQIWRERSTGQHWLGFFLLAWLLSWIQNNNLVWGFQSQFILAQYLPLLGLYFLHKSIASTSHKGLYFVFGVLAGISALGSMANGVLVLPILLFYAWLARMSWLRCGLLCVVAIAGISIYLYGYTSPGEHSSITQALLKQPLNVVLYVLTYIGGPFYYLLAIADLGVEIAQVAGLLFVIALLAKAKQVLNRTSQDSLQLALFVFVLCILGSAFVTAGGRVVFGISQALVSRYMTPALMAWAALFVLYLPQIEQFCARQDRKRWLIFVLLLSLLFVEQLKALRSLAQTFYHHEVSALAIALEVNDPLIIANIYPSVDGALLSSAQARIDHISIFGVDPIRSAKQRMGQNVSQSNVTQCQGFVNRYDLLSTDPRYIRVAGWFYDDKQHRVAHDLYFVDAQHKIRGIALAGMEREDVARAVHEDAANSGFIGYLQANSQGQALSLRDLNSGCQINLNIPSIR